MKILLTVFILLAVIGCKNKFNQVEIDFQNIDTINSSSKPTNKKIYKVAIAAMISPKETFISYQKLINYLEIKNDSKFELIQRKTYQEVNNLIEKGELDFAFICSGAYIELTNKLKVDIVAVPESSGKPFYQAYIIANKNLNINSFIELRNKSFAFTDPLSNSGRKYVLKKLKELNENEDKFFSNYIFTYAHDQSIELVNKGIIDGATVDGLIYNYLYNKFPNKVNNIKVIEKSEYYGIPPIVARSDKMKDLFEIKNLLLNMHKDSVGKIILSELLIDKFVVGSDSNYTSIRKVNESIK